MCENPNCILEDCTIEYGECHCGCHEKTKIYHQNNLTSPVRFKNHPNLYIRGHQNRKSPIEYIIDEVTNCWEWQRGKTNGYGRMKIEGKPIPAHRFYYEKYKGPIPEGLVIDH